MGKVHGWRIFKDVHQFKCICTVNRALNATKYLFCCVHKFWSGILAGIVSGIVAAMGQLIGCLGWALGRLRVAAWAAGPVRGGASFDGPRGEGVAEKEAGRAGEGRLIYHARSLAPLNIRTKPVCCMPVLLPGRCGIGEVHSYWSIRMCTGGTWVRTAISA